jgi:hypothetical protein
MVGSSMTPSMLRVRTILDVSAFKATGDSAAAGKYDCSVLLRDHFLGFNSRPDSPLMSADRWFAGLRRLSSGGLSGDGDHLDRQTYPMTY